MPASAMVFGLRRAIFLVRVAVLRRGRAPIRGRLAQRLERSQCRQHHLLLYGEFPTLPMTESHELTAILRAARGAGGSATTIVACE